MSLQDRFDVIRQRGKRPLFRESLPQHLCCIYNKSVLFSSVNSAQARRFLARHGCTFETGKGGHLLVRRGDRTSTLPQHGGRKQLGKGLWSKILKDLALKENR